MHFFSINVDANKLYPEVKYPVPVGTPLISPLVQWDHAQTWDVPKTEDFPSGSGGSNSATVYNIGKDVNLGWKAVPPSCVIACKNIKQCFAIAYDLLVCSVSKSSWPTTDINPESPDFYLIGHCIDGRVLYPATGYLVLAWRTLVRNLGVVMENTPVTFEDVTIHRATILPKTGERRAAGGLSTMVGSHLWLWWTEELLNF